MHGLQRHSFHDVLCEGKWPLPNEHSSYREQIIFMQSPPLMCTDQPTQLAKGPEAADCVTNAVWMQYCGRDATSRPCEGPWPRRPARRDCFPEVEWFSSCSPWLRAALPWAMRPALHIQLLVQLMRLKNRRARLQLLPASAHLDQVCRAGDQDRQRSGGHARSDFDVQAWHISRRGLAAHEGPLQGVVHAYPQATVQHLPVQAYDKHHSDRLLMMKCRNADDTCWG